MILYPLALSLGFGTTIMLTLKFIVFELIRKFKDHFICSIEIRSDDTVFKWVRKFLHDKEYIKETSDLTVRVKPNDDMTWTEWFLSL